MAANTSTPFLSMRHCDHDLQYRQFNEDNMKLIVLGRDERYPLWIKCVAERDLRSFLDVDSKIDYEGQKLERGNVYQALPGELCMVKTMSGYWRRCNFMEEDGSGNAKVYYLDYGIFGKVRLEDIRVSCFFTNRLNIYCYIHK